MQSFNFHTITEIAFGMEAEAQTAALVKKYGGTKAIIVYGKGSAEKSGLVDKITEQLAKAGIEYIKYGGVMPNPHLSYARAGVKAALEFGADFVLAIGGGSAIDAAKAIAHGTKNPETDIWQYWLGEAAVTQSLPIGVILTISAAGSETSNSAVLTNTDTASKRGLTTDLNRPVFAIMNPALTYTIPKYHIACGIADIMMHTLDRYFSPELIKGEQNEMTDEIAEGLLRNVVKHGLAALENPADYHAQSEIMWAGSLSHTGLTGLGRTSDFSVHQLGHELSAKYDAAHGASLTTVWGAWARYVVNTCPSRFARLGEKVWGTSGEEAAINAVENYFKQIGLPTNFSALGIGVLPTETLTDMAYRCTHMGKRKVGSFHPLAQDDIFEIYKAVNV